MYTIDELKAFGISEEDLFRCRVTDKYKLFMKFQIQRARDYYNLAKKGMYILYSVYICYVLYYYILLYSCIHVCYVIIIVVYSVYVL